MQTEWKPSFTKVSPVCVGAHTWGMSALCPSTSMLSCTAITNNLANTFISDLRIILAGDTDCFYCERVVREVVHPRQE